MIESFLILSFGFPLMTIVSAWIVSNFIWIPMKEKYIKEKLEPIVIPYKNRYPLASGKSITDNSGCDLDSLIVFEDTGDGLVLMRSAGEYFEYWSDPTPQYKILEAVARKFVCSFRCEHLYTNRLLELRKKWKKMQEVEQKKQEKVVKGGGVFANLKKVRKSRSRGGADVVCCDKANKFIKRGRLSECPYFKPEKKEESSFNFSDWKKIAFS